LKFGNLAKAIACIFAPLPAFAQLPLTVDQSIVNLGELQLDLSLAYANTTTDQLLIGQPIYVQTGPTSFVELPSLLGTASIDSDAIVSTIQLRTGISANLEAYVRGSYANTWQRSMVQETPVKFSQSGPVDTWMGIGYKAQQDAEGPGIFLFSEVAAYEKINFEHVSLNSALVGGTIFKAVDPAVFSVTASYRRGRNTTVNDQRYRPGSLIHVQTMLGLAMNEQVSVSLGTQWINSTPSTFENRPRDVRRTRTDLLLGVTYGFKAGDWIGFSILSNISGQYGSQLKLNWSTPI